MSINRRLGDSGEQIATDYYVSNGYEILARNWRAGRIGEIDIVARHLRTIVICEVKWRANAAFGSPAEAVTVAKQRRLRQLATAYLAAHPHSHGLDVRFDVAAITGCELDMYMDAF